MKLLNKSILHSLLLSITIFIISATFILYFSPAEAGSISEISYWSFWITLPFFILMIFPFYIILSNEKDKGRSWRKFYSILGVIIILSFLFDIYAIIQGGHYIPYTFFTLFYLIIVSILILIYKFLLNYSEKIFVYLHFGIIIIFIMAIFFSFFTEGECLSGDTNCYSRRAIEANDIRLCGGAYPGTICETNFFTAQKDESICYTLKDEKYKGIYLKSSCFAHFAIKNNNPSLCKFDEHAKKGCCSLVFGVDLYKEGLTEEQKSICGIVE